MTVNDLFLEHPPVFVGGLRRSGTTLMRKVLGSHSQLSFLSTELNFFEKFFDDKPLNEQRLDIVLHEILEFLNRKNCHVSKEQITERLQGVDGSWRNLFVAILDVYRLDQGKPACGEKSPLYEFYLPYLDDWFGSDGYRFVHVIRDPVDTYASHLFSSRNLGLEHPVEWASMWNRSVGIAIKKARICPRTYMYVLYDEFVKSPETQLAHICDFLGIDHQLERMLAMSDFEWQIADNSSFIDPTTDRANHIGKIRMNDDLNRAELLDETTKAIIGRYCAPLASTLGYEKYDRYLHDVQNEKTTSLGADLLEFHLNRLSFREYLSKIQIGYFLRRLFKVFFNMFKPG